MKTNNTYFIEGKIFGNKQKTVEAFAKTLSSSETNLVSKVTACGNRVYENRFLTDGESVIATISKLDLKGITAEIWAKSEIGKEEHVVIKDGKVTVKNEKVGFMLYRDDFDDLDEVKQKYGIEVKEWQFDEYGFAHIGGFKTWGQYKIG